LRRDAELKTPLAAAAAAGILQALERLCSNVLTAHGIAKVRTRSNAHRPR
jgi:hypothetical protein